MAYSASRSTTHAPLGCWQPLLSVLTLACVGGNCILRFLRYMSSTLEALTASSSCVTFPRHLHIHERFYSKHQNTLQSSPFGGSFHDAGLPHMVSLLQTPSRHLTSAISHLSMCNRPQRFSLVLVANPLGPSLLPLQREVLPLDSLLLFKHNGRWNRSVLPLLPLLH